jgi:hypothetical protein
MMKRILAASAALAAVAAFSAPAFAVTTSNSSTVTVNGNVTARCSVANPTSTVDLGELTTNTDGTLASQSKVNHFGDIWCNGTGNSITVTAHPLANTNTTADPSFVNQVNYTVTSTNPGLVGQTADSSSSTPLTVSGLPAFDTGITNFDQYTITTIASGTKKVIAGGYSGTIDVVVTPGS